jgi:hypothetical protein
MSIDKPSAYRNANRFLAVLMALSLFSARECMQGRERKFGDVIGDPGDVIGVTALFRIELLQYRARMLIIDALT